MKLKINYLFVFLGCLIFFPLTCNADCSYEREAELSRIASNVQFNYTYEINSGDRVDFTINITNLTSDIYIVDNYNNMITGTGEVSRVYGQLERLYFDIYSNDSNCKGKKIMTQYYSLPVYNVFYNSEICKKNKTNSLCDLWRDNSNYTYDRLEQQIKTAEKNNKITEEQNKLELKEFFIQNKNEIILVVVLIAFLVLITFIKNKRSGGNR